MSFWRWLRAVCFDTTQACLLAGCILVLFLIFCILINPNSARILYHP